MVVTYYIKLFRTGANRQNSVLMSLLLLIAETIKHAGVILYPYLVKTYYLLLDFLTRNIRPLTFSLIPTTVHDVEIKTDINITHLNLHIISLTTEFHYPETC